VAKDMEIDLEEAGKLEAMIFHFPQTTIITIYS